jgi:flagellar FliL protein
MTVSQMPVEEGPEKKGGKKKLLMILVLVVALAAAAWFLILKPGGGESEAEAAPVAGEVVPLEATQVNLAGGHYLRIGIALQLVEGAHELDGSMAMDSMISTFSNRQLNEVVNAKSREELRKKLVEVVDHRYHGEVMDVYFTEFVTQ